MKKIYTILLFFVVLSLSAQSKKSFVKSVQAVSKKVVIQLSGTSQVNEWQEDFIRITTTVQLTNFSEDILKRLFSVGRYSLVSVPKEGVLYLSMPKVLRPVSIKGIYLNEILNYEIFVPRATTVTVERVSQPSDLN